jgi:hypothetical protein
MTFTTFRNPCTARDPAITVLASFIEARQFALEHPQLIEDEVEAESADAARGFAQEDFLAARESYLEALYGNPY